jgi:hypothetical protein
MYDRGPVVPSCLRAPAVTREGRHAALRRPGLGSDRRTRFEASSSASSAVGRSADAPPAVRQDAGGLYRRVRGGDREEAGCRFYVISGRITKVGRRLALTMRLHATATGELLKTAARAARRASRSRTPDPGFARRTSKPSSGGSGRSATATAGGWAWASTSRGASWKHMAAGSGPRARQGWAARSASRCRRPEASEQIQRRAAGREGAWSPSADWRREAAAACSTR